MSAKPRATDGDLKRVEAGLRVWRSTRRRGARIPAALWAGAVAAAERHGLWKTARALGLDYATLKRHCDAARSPRPAPAKGTAPKVTPTPVVPGFVQVPWPADPGPDCQLELEDGRGVRLRVTLRGAGLAQLDATTRLLWGLSR